MLFCIYMEKIGDLFKETTVIVIGKLRFNGLRSLFQSIFDKTKNVYCNLLAWIGIDYYCCLLDCILLLLGITGNSREFAFYLGNSVTPARHPRVYYKMEDHDLE